MVVVEVSDCDHNLWTHFVLSSFRSTMPHLRVVRARYLGIDFIFDMCDDGAFIAVDVLRVSFA